MKPELFISLEAKTKYGCSFMLENGCLFTYVKTISKTKKTFKIQIKSNENGSIFTTDIDNQSDFNIKFH